MHPLQPEPARRALERNSWRNDWSQKTVPGLYSFPSLVPNTGISKAPRQAVIHISLIIVRFCVSMAPQAVHCVPASRGGEGIRHNARTVNLEACQHMCKGQAPGVIREESVGRACRVESKRLPASTGTSFPTSSFASAGVATIAVSVETVVIATDKGTSARARYVTTFEATPPGQDATRQILHATLHPSVLAGQAYSTVTALLRSERGTIMTSAPIDGPDFVRGAFLCPGASPNRVCRRIPCATRRLYSSTTLEK